MSGKYNEENKSIRCSVADRCGSCQYIEMAYEKELNKKKTQINKLFSGICEFNGVTGMYRPVFYRNKVHAAVGYGRDKKIITGNYMEGTHVIVSNDFCMIEDQKADEIIKDLKELFSSFKFSPYNEDTKKGFIRHILIRRGYSTKQILLCLVTADSAFPSKNNFIKAILEKHPDITTIVQNINDMSTSMILGKKSKVLYGKGYIEDVLCSKRFRISPESFYQINSAQTEKLYKAAIKLGKITKNDTVIDAYCGIGTIGIAVADKAKKVIGVELNSQAVKDAQINAKLNNIKNISFINSDAGDFLQNFSVSNKADVVIMDPPRSGSTKEFINALIKIKPDRIIYISCGPDTQARDVKLLIKGGYKIDACEAFDLFPHTEHTETIISMTI